MFERLQLLLAPIVLVALATPAEAQFLADLKPTYLKWSAGFVPGGKVRLDSTIKNVGLWGSSACTSGYYLSRDSSITSGDRLLYSFTTPKLAINASAKHNVTITVPRNVSAGTCYIGVFADRQNKLGELSNSNNTLSGKTTCYGKANLRITKLTSLSTRVPRGGRVSISTTIENDGGVNAGAYRLGFYLSTNSIISTGDTLLSSNSPSGLSAGKSFGLGLTVTIPTNARLGDCWLGVYADDTGKISEVVETDNWRSLKSRCYVPGSFRSYGSGCPGRSGSSRHTVVNKSGAPYIGTTTEFRIENGPRNFVSLLLLGFSDKNWGVFTLPLPLDSLGAKGCRLLVSPDVILAVGTNAQGFGSASLPHPNDPKLVGLKFYTQFSNVELGFNPLDLTFSGAVASQLGQL